MWRHVSCFENDLGGKAHGAWWCIRQEVGERRACKRKLPDVGLGSWVVVKTLYGEEIVEEDNKGFVSLVLGRV